MSRKAEPTRDVERLLVSIRPRDVDRLLMDRPDVVALLDREPLDLAAAVTALEAARIGFAMVYEP